MTRTRKSAPALKKLQFSDKLVGKGLTTDVLLKKLKILHKELQDLDQENIDTKTLTTVKDDLIKHSILLHKDAGVKAYAACCIAELLRLYAPDAPYTPAELRDIFMFFDRQLVNGLKSSIAPYYAQYYALLESLSTVKSVVLVCDLPNADELMQDIFRDFFVLMQRNLPKGIEKSLADILVALIDESESVPTDLLETIVKQFVNVQLVSDTVHDKVVTTLHHIVSAHLASHDALFVRYVSSIHRTLNLLRTG